MNRVVCAGLLAMLSQLGVDSAAAATSTSDGSHLYAPCVVCHQASAWGSPDGAIPGLAGQQRRYLEKQLAVFRAGAREDTAMQIVAVHSSFRDQRNIVAIADYLSGLDVNPRPVTGAGDHLRLGQDLYTHVCSACHGIDGLGQSGNRVPQIGGQHYPYLRRQIEAAAGLHNDLAPPEMTSALRGMPALEKDALADYISRLGNSESVLDSNRADTAQPEPRGQAHEPRR